MKLTKSKLKQLIKEELQDIMQEQLPPVTDVAAYPEEDPETGDLVDLLDDYPGIKDMNAKIGELRNDLLIGQWPGTPEGKKLARLALKGAMNDLSRAMGELVSRIRHRQI